MRRSQRGFTMGELILVVSVIAIPIFFGMDFIFNRPSQTQARGNDNLRVWLQENSIQATKRAGCAHDSDGDGWATCTVVVDDGEERISLQCVSGWWMGVTGAVGCKEVDGNFKVNRAPRPQ